MVIGEGFRFGRARGGDVEALRRSGIPVDAVPPRMSAGTPVSSTRVREALAAGRMDEARALLGREFRISGRVIEGRKLGREFGIPHRKPAAASPRVAGRLHFRGTRSGAGLVRQAGVASVGTRPTVGGTEWLLEVHVFDYDGELYGARLDVDFVARLRDEVRFDSVEAMTAADARRRAARPRAARPLEVTRGLQADDQPARDRLPDEGGPRAPGAGARRALAVGGRVPRAAAPRRRPTEVRAGGRSPRMRTA